MRTEFCEEIWIRIHCVTKKALTAGSDVLNLKIIGLNHLQADLNKEYKMVRWRNLTRFTVFLLIGLLVSALVRAETNDDAIYSAALNFILVRDKHNNPPEFIVWDTPISPEAITTPRVPNQNSRGQFRRTMPGLDSSLESELITSNSGKNKGQKIKFNISNPVIPFYGFANLASIRQAELQNKNSMVVIGFSKIAYSANGREALVYAEECSPGAQDFCGGYGFWFARDKADWRLRKYGGLWGGQVKPFWDFN